MQLGLPNVCLAESSAEMSAEGDFEKTEETKRARSEQERV